LFHLLLYAKSAEFAAQIKSPKYMYILHVYYISLYYRMTHSMYVIIGERLPQHV